MLPDMHTVKIMKNVHLSFLAAALTSAAFLCVGSQASADTLTLDYGSRHSGNGGEFNAKSVDFNPTTMGYNAVATFNGGFETFCLESNEYFNPGNSYYYGISQGAVNGGVSGGNPDFISKGTAWLYLNFAEGTLSGYTYTAGPAGNASAAALQATIWWLEGEGANPNNVFSIAVTSLPDYLDDNMGFYNVGVLNLWGDRNHTQLAQDQLVLLQSVPDSGTTVALLGLSLLGLVLVQRKLSQNRPLAAQFENKGRTEFSPPPPELGSGCLSWLRKSRYTR